ncbi:winged helix-turn-helix transcriptional regulator [Gammaproteobacteria bacterium PRO6]|nr:winged helix-turn-helix transcriptional regulator [Gammaproteobacteria bacterium PRO6]
MSENTETMVVDAVPFDIEWPEFSDTCDRRISEAVYTFLALLRASEAVADVELVASSWKPRAKDAGQDRALWAEQSRSLMSAYVNPARENLFDLELRDRYSAGLAHSLLDEVQQYLRQPECARDLPRCMTGVELIEYYLQPVFDSLQDVIAPDDWSRLLEDQHGGAVLLDRLAVMTLRQWFEMDGGRELERLLQYLVLGEYEIEEYQSGNYRNLFESAEDRLDLETNKEHICWNDAGVDALLSVIPVVRRRCLKVERIPSQREPKGFRYFCELCDEKTERIANECDPSKSGMGNVRYCAKHVSGRRGSRYKVDLLQKEDFDRLYILVLQEARRDEKYRRRISKISGNLLTLAFGHTECCECRLCVDRATLPCAWGVFLNFRSRSSHFWMSPQGSREHMSAADLSNDDFHSLMAFHANARKMAYQLAQSDLHSLSSELDEELKRRGDFAAALDTFPSMNKKLLGRHNTISIVRLLREGYTKSEVAEKVNLSPSAITQRVEKLEGCFDYAPERDPQLRAWPMCLGCIDGPHIAKFRIPSLDFEWRHSEDEYRHLAPYRRAVSNSQRRMGMSSSFPTKSSARR